MLEELNKPTGSPVDALRRSGESLLASGQEMLPFYPLTMEFWAASTAKELRKRLMEEFRQFCSVFGVLWPGLSGRESSGAN
jgi:hypothetical protein